jgi:4-aminobutyrate aminotransferase-like enzyme
MVAIITPADTENLSERSFMMSSNTLLERRYRVMGRHFPLFYQQPLTLVRGEGVWLYDNEDRRYLDMYNNVPHVGHCNPAVVAAMAAQAAQLNIHTRYLNEVAVSYHERLCATFDDSLSMLRMTCSGSEANELALRIVRHATRAEGIIVSDDAYHGNTAAVAELGTGFMSEVQNNPRVRSFRVPDLYRGIDGQSPELAAQMYLDSIEQAIAELQATGAGVAAMLFCPDFANEGLVNVPRNIILQGIERVRAAGGLIICDEVQAGFGRTGEAMWAHQLYDGLVPDLVTLGKPMGNGYPMAGVVSRPDLLEDFERGSMYFNTFAGTPLACAVGHAVLDCLQQQALLPQALATRDYLLAGLQQLQNRYSPIGDVRALGLFFAVELVQGEGREPNADLAGQVINRMKNDEKVLISRIGRFGNILKMRPPMVFNREHAEQLLTSLERVLNTLAEENPV